MRILSRYVLLSYLRLFAAILVGALATIAIIEALLNLEVILERDEGLAGVARYMLVRLPAYYLRELVPATSFAAAFLCAALAARSREVTAARAGGLPPQRVFAPVLAAAALLSVAALALNETVVHGASRAWRVQQTPEPGGRAHGPFWYHKGDFIYNIREADPATGVLRGVRVFELSPEGRLVQSIAAEMGRVDAEGRWRLIEATSQRFDPDRPGVRPRLEPAGDRWLEAGPWPRTGEAAATGPPAARLAAPLCVLLFALLGVPLGLRVERTRSVASSAVVGITILGLFYAARTTNSVLATAGALPEALDPWLALAPLAALAAVGFVRAPG